MTTIAFRDGVLASDSLTTCDGVRIDSRTKKVGHGWDQEGCPVLFAGVGDAALCQAFREWASAKLEDGVIKVTPPSMQSGDHRGSGFLFYERSGGWDVVEYEDDLPPFRVVVGTRGFAAGSGKDFARGAMAAGKSAVEAVIAAMDLDVYSGGDVQIAAFEQATRKIRNRASK